MYTATAVFDLLLPTDSRSLKTKRSYVRPIVAALRKFEVAVAEVGALDLHGRTEIGVVVVGFIAIHVWELMVSCEHLVFGCSEVEIIVVWYQLIGDDD